MLDVLDAHPIRAPEECRVRVRRIDDRLDLDALVAGVVDHSLCRVDEDGEMVQQRPLRLAWSTLVELDERPADLDLVGSRPA